MRIRLLIIAMYHENDQDPHEQGLQEHPELPQQVGLREQVLPSTQGPPGPTRSDGDAPGTLQQEPLQQLGAFSPINTPTKTPDPELQVGASNTSSGATTGQTVRGHDARTAPRGNE